MNENWPPPELVERCVQATYEQFAKERGTMPDPYEAARICLKIARDALSSPKAVPVEELREVLDEIAYASWPSVNGDDPVKRIQAFAKSMLGVTTVEGGGG